MKKILVLIGRYLPGYKDGGPIRTVKNLTDALGDECEFYIMCRDRDNGDTVPYEGITLNEWTKVGKANVMYVAENGFTRKAIYEVARNMDGTFSCGFMNDYSFRALSMHRGKLKHVPLGVACMGGLSDGAIRQKYLKKKVYILILKVLGYFKNITWAVSAPEERENIYKHIGKNSKCIICENIPRSDIPGKTGVRDTKAPLKVVFLSRIAAKKNLTGAIDILGKTDPAKGNIEFTIYGPKESSSYWEECEKKLALLPPHVNWTYGGLVPTEKVGEAYSGQDAFLFPTLGENFGHVIYEALSAGCIPILSDQTPWKLGDAGYVIPLEKQDDFVKAVEELETMTSEDFMRKSEGCVEIARTKVEQSRLKTGYRELLGI